MRVGLSRACDLSRPVRLVDLCIYCRPRVRGSLYEFYWGSSSQKACWRACRTVFCPGKHTASVSTLISADHSLSRVERLPGPSSGLELRSARPLHEPLGCPGGWHCSSCFGLPSLALAVSKSRESTPIIRGKLQSLHRDPARLATSHAARIRPIDSTVSCFLCRSDLSQGWSSGWACNVPTVLTL